MNNKKETKYHQLNERIEVLGLTPKTNYMLSYAGYNTIADIIANYKNLFYIKNMKAKIIEEIKKGLVDKCNINIYNENVDELRELNLSQDIFYYLTCHHNVATLNQVLNIPRNNLLRIKQGKKVVSEIHELGYNFNFEKKKKKEKEITLKTKLYDTDIYNINKRIFNMTIEELLKLSTNPKSENSLYMIRNIGPNKAKKIIDIIHSYGFLFENEKIIKKNGEKEINNILENLYQKLDLKFISEEFYEKVITPEDFNTNYFVLSFTKLVKDLNEKKNIYLTDKEITSFLYKKLLNNKKKLLEISNNISKKLELKKVNILK